jgi:hypothetical protein
VRSAWAKFPTAWLQLGGEAPCPLAALQWSGYRTTGQAALLLLIALAIRLNLARRNRELEVGPANLVAVRYDELQDLVRVARATVSKAIGHLEAWGAIRVHPDGRRSVYELRGVEFNGGWCQLPQSRLLNAGGTALAPFTGGRANRFSLNAVKLYVLLMAKRYQRFNTTALGYTAIGRLAGIRREEISNALQQLIALQLVSLAAERSDGREDVDERTQRYVIEGLSARS